MDVVEFEKGQVEVWCEDDKDVDGKVFMLIRRRGVVSDEFTHHIVAPMDSEQASRVAGALLRCVDTVDPTECPVCAREILYDVPHHHGHEGDR